MSDCVRAGGVLCEAGHKDYDAARVFSSLTMQTGELCWEGGMAFASVLVGISRCEGAVWEDELLWDCNEPACCVLSN